MSRITVVPDLGNDSPSYEVNPALQGCVGVVTTESIMDCLDSLYFCLVVDTDQRVRHFLL